MMSNVISFQVSLMLNLVQIKEIEMQFFTHWIFSSSPKGTILLQNTCNAQWSYGLLLVTLGSVVLVILELFLPFIVWIIVQ